MLPEGQPGEAHRWISAPASPNTRGDSMQLRDLERLQFSLRPAGSSVPKVESE